jgi:hypothetical protein
MYNSFINKEQIFLMLIISENIIFCASYVVSVYIQFELKYFIQSIQKNM